MPYFSFEYKVSQRTIDRAYEDNPIGTNADGTIDYYQSVMGQWDSFAGRNIGTLDQAVLVFQTDFPTIYREEETRLVNQDTGEVYELVGKAMKSEKNIAARIISENSTAKHVQEICERVSLWPDRIAGTHYGCIVVRFTKHNVQPGSGLHFKKDEILTVNPRNWDNRTEETFMYAGKPIELSAVEFVADQRIPAHLKVSK
ncbi:hypothetical protein [Brevibacillus sp. 179-C9.3 HS]|uniref:hypothetical protein n=1 Tax=unclassified Brevibacillus TaxID=2684853 RepID=UPI00399F0DA6